MKNAHLIGMLFLSMALAAGTAGCKHNPQMVTPIPGGGPPQGGQVGTTDNTPPLNPGGAAPAPTVPVATGEPIPITSGGQYAEVLDHGTPDREKFKADTVYFDFDSSAIKPSEESKLQDISSYFKDNKTDAVVIEGNCDERGTEKYNLSLGERRALAAREYLANLGVDPARIKTVTYGASHPVDPGHNEAAWKQNRRDDFVLMTPSK